MTSFECAALKASTRALAYRRPIILSSSGSSVLIWIEADECIKCVKTFKPNLCQPVIGIRFEATCLAGPPLDQDTTQQTVLIYSTQHLLFCSLTVRHGTGKDNSIHCELKQNFTANLVYWIIDCVFGSDRAYILNSRNEVLVYSLSQQKILARIYGPQRCILYSGKFLQYSHNGLAVASGTVFKTILLWAVELVNANDKCQHSMANIQALDGHDGVIFSVDYNWQKNIIVSASDDRSIRIWTGNAVNDSRGAPELMNMQFWKENGSFQLAHVYYGHAARIWKVASLSWNSAHFIISSGEDSSIASWSLLPPYSSIQKKWLFRNNRIWSFEALHQHIAFGGSDSSVKMIAIDELLGQGEFQPQRVEFPLSSSPKAICHLKSGNLLLCASTHGNIYIIRDGNILQKAPLDLNFESNGCLEGAFDDYICMQNNPSRSKIIIASKYGHLCLLKATTGHLKCVHTIKPFQSKIFDVSFVNEHQFLCCLVDGQMKLFSVGEKEEDIIQPTNAELTFLLPASRQPWSSCGVLVGNLLIVGDYTGSVFAYRTNSPDASSPVNQFRHVHGRNGVNCLKQRPHSSFVYSSGRNGRIIEYLVEATEEGPRLDLLRTYAILQMEWIGGFHFDSCFPYSMKYAFGFESRSFFLWDMPENRIVFEEECGGGHRSWDLTICNDTTETMPTAILQFSYTKQNHLTSVCRKLPPSQDPSSSFATYSSLPRHINCCAHLNILRTSEWQYFLLAGEDNVIQVVRFHRTTHELRHCITLYTHISNVSSIKCSPLCTENGLPTVYAISAGGRSQLVVWRFTFTLDEELVCHERISNFLGTSDDFEVFSDRPRKTNKISNLVQSDLDIRFLDVDCCQSPHFSSEHLILVACSDSSARLLRYNDQQRQIVKVEKISCETGCVLLTRLIASNNLEGISQHRIICALASTEGYLSLWAVSETTAAKPDLSCKLHQAGINAIDFRFVNQTLLVLTGGDDNALKLAAISINQDSLCLHYTVDLSPMHTCQITGLRFLSNGDEFVSCGIDQRVVRWKVAPGDGTGQVRYEAIDAYVSSIADISSLDIISSKKRDHWLLICGEGYELLKITSPM